MSNLKTKLAQKIEDTSDNEVNTEKSSIIADSVKEDNNLIPGYIETIYPGIYLRSKCLSKQKVFINKIED